MGNNTEKREEGANIVPTSQLRIRYWTCLQSGQKRLEMRPTPCPVPHFPVGHTLRTGQDREQETEKDWAGVVARQVRKEGTIEGRTEHSTEHWTGQDGTI